MKLTFFNRLRLCLEILTAKSGHTHVAQEKQLSTFIRGYEAGLKDGKLNEKRRKSTFNKLVCAIIFPTPGK